MNKRLFDEYNGRTSFVYLLENESIVVEICDFGARINSLKFNGVDIALGFNSIAEILDSATFAGATIGRVGNRIASGKFVLNGKEYSVTCNEGKNHLHGGNGFDKKFFEVIRCTGKSITLQYISPDGEEGYPGTLNLTVKYTVKDNTLRISYQAECSTDTLWNPTNHTYFNLDGENSGDCRENMISINAATYTPTDIELIPTGEVLSVKETPFDFTRNKDIGSDFGCVELSATNGYDHNFILNGKHAARIESVKTGIIMDIYSNMPCIQFYTGGAIKPCKGKTINYNKWAGFCLEPQFCPNAINMVGFEKPILKKDEIKKHYIKYEFYHENQ